MKMKKFFMFVFALVALLSLASCGAKEYKLGMGIEVSTSSSSNANATKDGNAQVDATVAAVVLDAEGKIVTCRIDTVQNKIKVSNEGVVTVPASFKTKMELGFDYNMAAYGTPNYGEEVKEWFEQAKLFEEYVVGKTASEVNGLELQSVNNHNISKDENLLASGCTIDLTDFIAAVVKACNDEQSVSFTAGEFTLGVAANSANDGSKNASADAVGAVQVYSDFAATVVADGKIAAALNDAIQPKFEVSATGTLTAKYTDTKRVLKEKYNMAAYGTPNYGEEVKEWYIQSALFSEYVVGKNATEVSGLELQSVNNHNISKDENLLASGCTIELTGIKAVIAKAFNNAR